MRIGERVDYVARKPVRGRSIEPSSRLLRGFPSRTRNDWLTNLLTYRLSDKLSNIAYFARQSNWFFTQLLYSNFIVFPRRTNIVFSKYVNFIFSKMFYRVRVIWKKRKLLAMTTVVFIVFVLNKGKIGLLITFTYECILRVSVKLHSTFISGRFSKWLTIFSGLC